LDFAYDTVLSLTIACTVEENNAFKHGGIRLLDILVLAVFIVRDQVTQVLNRHLGISNHKLLLILVKHHGNVEHLVCAFSQVILDAVVAVELISVHGVHGHFVVVDFVVVLLLQVALYVVALVDFILI